MTASWPAKADYATGDVLSATNMNDLAGVVNFMNPTGTTNGYVLTADSTQTGKVKWAAAGGGGSSGLTKIVSQSFSASSSVSVNTCFSSTYTNYKIIFNFTASASANTLRCVLRNGSTDNTATKYESNGQNIGANTTNNYVSSGYWNLSTMGTSITGITLDMENPFVSSFTAMQGSTTYLTSGSAAGGLLFSSYFDQSYSADGFTFYPSAGTITGTVSVYGYQA